MVNLWEDYKKLFKKKISAKKYLIKTIHLLIKIMKK